jgi:hypothetical protein
MGKVTLSLFFFLIFSLQTNANVLDDLIIKKEPTINQIIIELLKAGLTEESDELDSRTSAEIGKDICEAAGRSSCWNADSIGEGICMAAGRSSCWNADSIGEGICMAAGRSSCWNADSIGEGICMAGGGSSCWNADTIEEGIKKIPFKDRTYWWDRFRDQYGNYLWRCRGGQTKQFAENSKCSGVSKDDDRWPG